MPTQMVKQINLNIKLEKNKIKRNYRENEIIVIWYQSDLDITLL